MHAIALLLLTACTGGHGSPAASGDSGGSCAQTWWYRDADGDDWGVSDERQYGCDPGAGWSQDYPDCDDSNATVYPGAPETWYDGIDNDCDGGVNDDDADADGFAWDGAGGDDCDDDDEAINPDAVDVCASGIDENCDGAYAVCGFGEEMVAGDAAVHIDRDGDLYPVGQFARFLGSAQDSDGDGMPEFVARVSGAVGERTPKTGYLSAYYLIGDPLQGDHDLETTAIARWTMDVQTWILTSRESFEPGIDLDQDGYLDYLFSTDYGTDEDGDGHLESASRLDLWYGPTDPLMNLGEGALTLDDAPDPWDVGLWHGVIKMLQPPESGNDWILATSQVASIENESVRPAVHLLTAQNFEGTRGWDDSPTVWSTGGDTYDAGNMLEVGDVDGDGFADIAVLSNTVYTATARPPRVWIMRGPDFADRSLSDADVILDADTGNVSDVRFKLLPGMERSGQPVVTARLETLDGPGWFFYELPDSGMIGTDDAYTAIVQTDDHGINGDLVFGGDLDADGSPELALGAGPVGATRSVVLMDVPEAGIIPASDYDVIIRQDDPEPTEDPVSTNFGEAMLSNIDFNADGFPDLLISEPYWDGDIPGCCSEYGRLSLFHGGPIGF